MATAYKCDGCGDLFGKRYDNFNRYMPLPSKKEARTYLSLFGNFGNSTIWNETLDLCHECLKEIMVDYSSLIIKELEREMRRLAKKQTLREE